MNLSDSEDLIVVDGGSDDSTVSIAREYTGRVLSSGRGRAKQMNAGAEAAEGDILFFLHADCAMPEGGFDEMRNLLADRRISAGGFWLSIEHPGLAFRIIERGSNLRSAVTRLIYGDQGMFLRTATFRKIGGFAEIPLMEDIEISRRLKQEGKIAFANPPIRTLPRRWIEEGAFITTLRDWKRAISYTVFKASPEKLSRRYRDVR